jgi:hypothetical protein
VDVVVNLDEIGMLLGSGWSVQRQKEHRLVHGMRMAIDSAIIITVQCYVVSWSAIEFIYIPCPKGYLYP